ncbi:1-acyl-sn-glycerol-3-phosphate acyltransferase [Mucilaginibacter arboris]|uniref:Glycerol acyltransferase n=1 Tax=Mucilaginibacter arboris TaxID=2682090 RepID=A0A7K1T115_9SPHI|nr:1-acyl-sn-glycerol-3-phosphate acyltransferase [Mucilaginibacter arboris]MVN23228.1 glycerol acyltransferase [Mucilaginibacter arboris]
MITSNRNRLFYKLFLPFMRWRMLKSFRALTLYNQIEIKPGHSVLLLCNHFSWWDGFLAAYLGHFIFHKKIFTMMQEDHLQQRMWLRRLGSFSISRTSRDMLKSMQYAALQLDRPENIVTVFPQGALESNHSTEIRIEKGISYLVRNIKGNCQIVYASVFVDYFESFKPTAYFHLLDCGTNHDFSLEKLTKQINGFHQQALKNQINVSH